MITGSLIFQTGVVFADRNQNNIVKVQTIQMNETHKGHGKSIKIVLERLVKKGAITQEKSNAIMKYIDEKNQAIKNMTEEQRKAYKSSRKVSFFEEMKNAGIVSDADIKAIKEEKSRMHDEKLTEKLNTLVQKGVITSSDVTKIKDYMKAEREEHQKNFEKIKTMTEEERKEYFKNNKMQRKNVIEKMVEDKVITKEQAKEIKNAVPWLDKSGNKNYKYQCPKNHKQ